MKNKANKKRQSEHPDMISKPTHEVPLGNTPFLKGSIMPEMGGFLHRIFTSPDGPNAAIAREEEEIHRQNRNVNLTISEDKSIKSHD